jgi:hypothetical protein
MDGFARSSKGVYSPEMTSGSAALPAKTPDQKGVLSTIVDIFVDPKSAFQAIAIAPRWWVPMLLSIVATLVFMALFANHVGWENMARRNIEKNERMQEMPAADRERAIEMQVSFMRIWGYVGPPLAIPVVSAIMAGVLLFVFKLLLDAQVTFIKTLAVVVWSGLPTLLSTAAAIAVMLLKSPSEFDLENPVGFNVGFYLPEGTSAWLVSLASSIDLFSIWVMLLMATGMSIIARKPWGTALMGIVLPWAIYVTLKVLFAAMFR